MNWFFGLTFDIKTDAAIVFNSIKNNLPPEWDKNDLFVGNDCIDMFSKVNTIFQGDVSESE